MSNEMKLLTALCEALGFEIKRELDYQERKESKDQAMYWNDGTKKERVLATKGAGMMLDIDSDGYYTSMLREPIVSYKLLQRGT